MSNVAALPVPEDERPVVQAPALGYSITANLGDDRQIVTQCFADSEEPLASIHAKVDKAMAVIDRQKAKFRKVDAVKSVEEMQRTLRRLKADLGEAEKNFEMRQQELDDRTQACVAARQSIQDEAIARGRVSGPVGAEAQRFKALKSEMDAVKLEKEKACAERKVARDQAAVNILRYEEEIAKAEAQIAECDALIAGG